MSIRVLMISPFFQPMICGISVYVTNLVKGLVEQGVYVNVQTMRYDGHPGMFYSDDSGLNVTRYRNLPFFGHDSLNQPISISHIKETLEASANFDIVHIHDCPKLLNDLILLTLKRIKPKLKIVLTPQGPGVFGPTYIMSSKTTGAQFEVPYDQGISYFLQKIFSKLYWSSGVPYKVVRSADHVIAVTPMQEKVFANICDKNKLTLIPEAIPAHYFKEAPCFSDNRKLKVLFIGRIIREKGLGDLLHAIQLAKKNLDGKIELRCIGPDFGYMQDAYRIIRDLDIGDVVDMLGAVSESEKIANLNWCDVLVLPSYHEAFGIPIVEAMASGKPVVATKTVGASSLIKDGVTGFLVNFADPQGIADALMSLNNPDLRNKMGWNALASAREYSMDKMISKHINLYKKLLNEF